MFNAKGFQVVAEIAEGIDADTEEITIDATTSNGNVELPAGVVDALTDNGVTTSVEIGENTTISLPSGAFANVDTEGGSPVSLAIEMDNAAAAEAAIDAADNSALSEENAEMLDNAIVVGAISITLNQGGSGVEVKDLAEPIVISHRIGALPEGFTVEDIKVVVYGNSGAATGEVLSAKSYDPATGIVTFEVTHLTSFVIVLGQEEVVIKLRVNNQLANNYISVDLVDADGNPIDASKLAGKYVYINLMTESGVYFSTALRAQPTENVFRVSAKLASGQVALYDGMPTVFGGAGMTDENVDTWSGNA